MKQEIVVLDGKRYVINAWATTEQIRNMPLIGKAFAVPLAMCLSEDRGLDESLPEALFALFNQMEDHGVEELFNMLFSKVFLNDTPVTLDDSFDGIDGVLQVAAKVINLNYGVLYSGKGLSGFLTEIAPLAQQAQS